MKKTIVALALTLFTLPTFAGWWPTPEEAAANYQTCMAEDESWYNRWGQYLASFDHIEAYKICRGVYQNAGIDTIGCYSKGKWLKAGYICDFEY